MKNGNEYRVVNYFDVWGNAEDGYEVNDCNYEGNGLFLVNGIEDQLIIDMLIEIGYLKEGLVVGRDINVFNLGDRYEIEELDGKPIYGLEMVDE